MDKSEVALSLALALIERGQFFGSGDSNAEKGANIASLYNGIFENLQEDTD